MPIIAPSPPNLLETDELLALLPSTSSLLNKFPDSLFPFLHAFWKSHYHLFPAFSLSLLFISSTWYTESISTGKYPTYKAYQERVSMFGGLLTFFKGQWLALTGRAAEVNAALWESGQKVQKTD
jgi:hypothetical protein